jgi:cytochrome c6
LTQALVKRVTPGTAKGTKMKAITGFLVAVGISMVSTTVFASDSSGKILFKDKCASCHPDGGNILEPKENLFGLENSAKIVKKIRKGGGGMPAYDKKSISDSDAKLLADYIMETFKK